MSPVGSAHAHDSQQGLRRGAVRAKAGQVDVHAPSEAALASRRGAARSGARTRGAAAGRSPVLMY